MYTYSMFNVVQYHNEEKVSNTLIQIEYYK